MFVYPKSLPNKIIRQALSQPFAGLNFGPQRSPKTDGREAGLGRTHQGSPLNSTKPVFPELAYGFPQTEVSWVLGD